ncbi:hypothetical protein J6590_032678 [Homalodisca vitripennis]|nr:hypothetical protein J6590_032678 [Homalodisca vitripennis]
MTKTFKIHVGNLSSDTREEDLLPLFRKYGEVIEFIIKDYFGFLHMKDEESGAAVLKNLNGHLVRGHRIRLHIATNKDGPRTQLKKTSTENDTSFFGYIQCLGPLAGINQPEVNPPGSLNIRTYLLPVIGVDRRVLEPTCRLFLVAMEEAEHRRFVVEAYFKSGDFCVAVSNFRSTASPRWPAHKQAAALCMSDHSKRRILCFDFIISTHIKWAIVQQLKPNDLCNSHGYCVVECNKNFLVSELQGNHLVCRKMWFQHDGAIATTVNEMMSNFGGASLMAESFRVLGKLHGQLAPQNLAFVIFFLYRFLKARACTNIAHTLEKLIVAMSQEVTKIYPAMLVNLFDSFSARLDECVVKEGHQLKNMLFIS